MDYVKLVKMAAAAYEPPQNFNRPCAYFNDVATDSQAYVLDDGGHVIIAVRGNDSLRDVVFDAKVCSVPVRGGAEGCEVHAGFEMQAERLYDQMRDCVTEMLQGAPDKDLIVTGHSGGGAIGGVLAMMFKDSVPNLRVSYAGFGSPGFANKKFRADFLARMDSAVTFRYCNDPIPEALKFMYVHPAEQVRLGERREWRAFPMLIYMADHSSQQYVNAVTDYANGEVYAPNWWNKLLQGLADILYHVGTKL